MRIAGDRQQRLAAAGAAIGCGPCGERSSRRRASTRLNESTRWPRRGIAAHQRVVGIDHGGLAAVEDARLGGRVVGERVVAVQVIGRDVEHRRGRGAQRLRGLELEARELEHVEAGAGALEQVERRLAEVAAGDAPRAPAAFASIAPTSVVTVLLPLVPVIADHRRAAPRARTARCRRPPAGRAGAASTATGSRERQARRDHDLRDVRRAATASNAPVRSSTAGQLARAAPRARAAARACRRRAPRAPCGAGSARPRARCGRGRAPGPGCPARAARGCAACAVIAASASRGRSARGSR